MATMTIKMAPRLLRDTPRWVLWRWHPRGVEWGKIPATANSGPDGVSAHEPRNWMTYEEAVAELARIERNGTWAQVGGGGLGFVFDGSDGVGGVDLDGCRNPQTGHLAGWAQEVVDAFAGTFIEVSPSGGGLHIYALGAPSHMSRTQIAMPCADGDPVIEGKSPFVEAYVEGRFFTFSGNAVPGFGAGVIACPEGWARVMALLGAHDCDEGERSTRDYDDVEIEVVESALGCFSSDDVDRNTFVTIGHVIKHQFEEDGYATWADWMAKSPYDDPDMTRSIWDGLRGAPRSMTLGTVFWLAQQKGWVPPWRSDDDALDEELLIYEIDTEDGNG